MKPINVEILLCHSVGISDSYYRPTANELLEGYLKAVPLLTINGENHVLRKQINELTEKADDYLIKAKLQEQMTKFRL